MALQFRYVYRKYHTIINANYFGLYPANCPFTFFICCCNFYALVVFQPFFTVDTSRYFKMCYNESPTSKSPTTPTSGPSPVKTPSPTTTATKPKSTPPSRPPPPLQAPPQSRIASEKNLQRAMSSSSSTSDVDQKSVASTEHEEGEGAGVTPSPATGQVHPVDQLQPAGQEQTDGKCLM